MAMGFILSLLLASCGPNQNSATSQNLGRPPELKINSIAFGKEDWERYFGEVNEEPALPEDISYISESACPFWPDKKIKETHLLVMIPRTVGGVPLTPSQMIKLAQDPQKGRITAPKAKKSMKTVRRGDNVGEANALWDSEEDITTECLRDLDKKWSPHTPSYWILMTRDVVATSRRNVDLDDYPGYDVPTVLEASTAILTHYVSTDGPWLYEKTHPYCKETRGDKDSCFFTGKSNSHNRLIIDNKTRTAIRIEGGDAPNEKIPNASRGQALVRRL